MENDQLATFTLFVQHGRPLNGSEEKELQTGFRLNLTGAMDGFTMSFDFGNEDRK
jgi:hypothetical protein